MSAIDSARRLAIGRTYEHAAFALAMDQAFFAIALGAPMEPTSEVVGAFIKTVRGATADLATGLMALMPNHEGVGVMHTSTGEHEGGDTGGS